MSEIQSCFQRYEKKYLLTPAQYRAVKQGMAPYMKPDAYPHYTISNLYYDAVKDASVDLSFEIATCVYSFDGTTGDSTAKEMTPSSRAPSGATCPQPPRPP